MTSLFKKLWEQKLVRFLFVGCFNTAFDTTMLLSFIKFFNWRPVVANSLSVTISISLSYFLNHRIVFRHTSDYSLRKYLRFFLVTGLGVILIQDLIIYVVTERVWIISSARMVMVLSHSLHLKTIEILCAKLSAVLLGMVWNYLLYKYVVFHDHKNADWEEDELIIG